MLPCITYIITTSDLLTLCKNETCMLQLWRPRSILDMAGIVWRLVLFEGWYVLYGQKRKKLSTRFGNSVVLSFRASLCLICWERNHPLPTLQILTIHSNHTAIQDLFHSHCTITTLGLRVDYWRIPVANAKGAAIFICAINSFKEKRNSLRTFHN